MTLSLKEFASQPAPNKCWFCNSLPTDVLTQIKEGLEQGIRKSQVISWLQTLTPELHALTRDQLVNRMDRHLHHG